MTDVEVIRDMLSRCTPEKRREVFDYLRPEFVLHPLESQLHAKAEVLLEAIQRAGGLTLRMIRGVIAEAAFDVEIAGRLIGWQSIPQIGNNAFDVLLRDNVGDIRVQVKLQRSKAGAPMTGRSAGKANSFADSMYVVETQKTRAGTAKTGGSTRPYRFGEFDVLAVSMYPSTNRWDKFVYTVGSWLLPDPKDSNLIRKLQPVAPAPNDDWTDDFVTVVNWFRTGTTKTIRTQ